jgi:hypothetical protein
MIELIIANNFKKSISDKLNFFSSKEKFIKMNHMSSEEIDNENRLIVLFLSILTIILMASIYWISLMYAINLTKDADKTSRISQIFISLVSPVVYIVSHIFDGLVSKPST